MKNEIVRTRVVIQRNVLRHKLTATLYDTFPLLRFAVQFYLLSKS